LERRRGRRIRMPYGFTLYGDVKNFSKLWHPPPDAPF
jgi:hypothetical protein